MNQKRTPNQRKRTNKKVGRPRKGLGQHQLDVRVKRRAGTGVRRHLRIPLIAKVCAVAFSLVTAAFVGRNVLGRFLWNNPAYTLTTIDFETDGWLTRPVALETADVTTGVNVLSLDLEDIRDCLVALPQVKDTAVERVLPDRLVISVKERHPIAWLSCPEQNIYPKVKINGFLLDEEGVALPCTQMRPEYVSFPVVVAGGLAAIVPGQPVGSDQLVSALELVRASSELLYDHALEIVEIKLVNDYSLLARFNNQTKVTFKPSDIGRQVEDLRAIVEDSLRKNRLLETVNLLPERNIAITFAHQPVPGGEAGGVAGIPRAMPVERHLPPGTGEDDALDTPQQGRRAVRALRSIPQGSLGAGPAAIDPDLDSILNSR